MGRKNVVVCDGCGQEKDIERAPDWIVGKIDNLESGRGGQEEIIVDSWECFKRVIDKRIENTKAA